jgi:hypothetical protein
MKSLELAKLGYASYGRSVDFKNYQGLPMPEWDDLPEKIQEAWKAAARSIADAVDDEHSRGDA